MSIGRLLLWVGDGRAAGAPMPARAAENVRIDKAAPTAARALAPAPAPRVDPARMVDRDRRPRTPVGGVVGRGRDRPTPLVMMVGATVPTVPATGLRVGRVRVGGPAVVVRGRVGPGTAAAGTIRAVRGTPLAALAATGLWPVQPEWPGPGGSPDRGPTRGVMTGPPAARGETLVGGVRRHRAATVRASSRPTIHIQRFGRPSRRGNGWFRLDVVPLSSVI